ncbi:tripartite tricarboxylate transporter substrate binding protein [Sinobaca sp. H24]|uniref:Bug family tripartite tricarboxylate transporter substrate binding protein n=1 Tax=Sinobaca sp. H24 TaxID=2923376 RepID=UPI00207AE32C|nr:tripartite tricarboxylate transporter substrate binding protein [Sinobaca sp. H24]
MKSWKAITSFTCVTASLLTLAACGGQSEESGSAEEADFPEEDITIVVHTSAGGPTDLMARELGSAVETIIDQNVVIENLPGGSGATQMSEIASAENNGYTLGTMTPSQMGLLNGTLADQYSLEDFSWITRTQIDPYIIAVHEDSEFETLEDLVSYAEENPNDLNVGGYGGTGSGHNIAFNIFSESANIETNWTAYESTGDAVTALLGQHVDVINSNPGEVSQYVESGEVRILGVMAEEELAEMPDVPTYEEAGYDVDTDWSQFRGIYAPADVPDDVKENLSELFIEAMETEEYQEYMTNAQMQEGSMTNQEYDEFIQNQDELTSDWYERLGVNE